MIPENDCDFNFDLKDMLQWNLLILILDTGGGYAKNVIRFAKKLKQFIINIDILKQEFQDYKFKVIRTNGKIEQIGTLLKWHTI